MEQALGKDMVRFALAVIIQISCQTIIIINIINNIIILIGILYEVAAPALHCGQGAGQAQWISLIAECIKWRWL